MQTAPSDMANNGMNFYAAGTAATAHNLTAGRKYGGLVYGYESNKVHMWVPADTSDGCLNLVGGIWGAGLNAQCANDDPEVTVIFSVNNDPSGKPSTQLL